MHKCGVMCVAPEVTEAPRQSAGGDCTTDDDSDGEDDELAQGPDTEPESGDDEPGLTGSPQSSDSPDRQRELAQRRLEIGGELIPVIGEYEYLGLMFNGFLDIGVVIKDRAAKGSRALLACRRVLGCSQIPLGCRVQCLSALVYSALTYGGEFFGMWGGAPGRAMQVVLPLEKVAINGLGMIQRCTWDAKPTVGSGLSASALRVAYDLPPIGAICAGKRARAFYKWRASAKGWIKCFLQHEIPRRFAHNRNDPGFYGSRAGRSLRLRSRPERTSRSCTRGTTSMV